MSKLAWIEVDWLELNPIQVKNSLAQSHGKGLTEQGLNEQGIVPGIKVHKVYMSHDQFQKGNILGWIAAITNSGSKKQQRLIVGIVLSFRWHVWKERNRRVFDHKECNRIMDDR
jgi:hypothetical protein